MSKQILGLDLGTNSIGWALLSQDEQETHTLLATGVRIFSQVTDPKSGDIKNATRRASRLARRNLERRVRRQSRLLDILIESDLLPRVTIHRDETKTFQEQYWSHPDIAHLERKNPLRLRAEGVEKPLELSELGRALYHLGQKRGFKSTTKRATKEDTDFKVKISELRTKLGGHTLGQYLYAESEKGFSTHNLGTDRHMYEEEFEKIWATQSHSHLEILTDEKKSKIFEAIFYQRPLKSQDDLIGDCKYFPQEKKVAKSHPLAQEFIILGYLNNLTYTDQYYKKWSVQEHFGDQLEAKITEGVEIFRSKQEIKRADLVKWLGISDERWLNTSKDKWTGDIIHQRLTKIFGTSYGGWDESRKNGLIEALKLEDQEMAHTGGSFKTKKGKTVVVRGYKDFNIDPSSYEALDAIDTKDIPSKYIDLGPTALSLFLGELRKGRSYKTIEKELQESGKLPPEYHNKYEKLIGLRRMKQVEHMTRRELKKLHSNHLPDIRNPRVTKALVELRKLLRAIVSTYGSLDTIRIETAKDLKNGTKLRKEIEGKQKKNREKNELLQKEMRELFPARNPDIYSDDFIKYKLWSELGNDRICPYHTKGSPEKPIIIGASDLYSLDSIQIEHILPLSRSLDDSLVNKTLCPRAVNLDKGNKTPYEYYNGPHSDDWKAFEARVWNIYGYTRKGEKERRLSQKGRRLLMTREETEKKLSEFTTQDLNDTSYIAQEAKEFCQALVGESRSKQQLVQTTKGQLTSVLRHYWRWNELLNPHIEDPDEKNIKNRGDHRHHAIDAVIIALSDQKLLQKASIVASQAEIAGKKLEHLSTVWGKTLPEINWLTDELARQLDSMHISHAMRHKVQGEIYEGTIYGKIRIGTEERTVVKKPIGAFFQKQNTITPDKIVDPIIRDDIQKRIENGDFLSPYKHPVTHQEIKSLRIFARLTQPIQVGKGYYNNSDNHHIEILECTSGKKKGTKYGIVIQLSEAYDRKKQGYEYIYNRHGPWTDRSDGTHYSTDEYRYLYSLTKGDLVEWEDGKVYQFTGCNNQKTIFLYPEKVSEKTALRHFPLVDYTLDKIGKSQSLR